MSKQDDGGDDVDPQVAADRVTFRQGQLIGIFLGVALVGVAFAYNAGAFNRPPPRRDAFPCGNDVVNLEVDPENCGMCGHVCMAELPVCRASQCECEEGFDLCNDGCAQLDRDPRHCGACDHACGPGVSCEAGACRCDAPLVACEAPNVWPRAEVCVDLRTDPENCGACQMRCPTARGGSCHEGVCDCGELTRCSFATDPSSCVDTQTDPSHCGECGHDCEGGECMAGRCH